MPESGIAGTTNKKEAQKTFLLHAARRYIWWETTNGAMAYPQKILAQVMNIGVWNDMCKLVELFPPQELLNVLDKAEIGQFNEKSWHFWHNRLSEKIPSMPKRVLE
ncbi:MAG: hypothetical protein LBT08_10890 [Synergistaceae bacterium]|jgi:hypothetical protein|nr:hypothetical protein [Synergistaceae bacterium]